MSLQIKDNLQKPAVEAAKAVEQFLGSSGPVLFLASGGSSLQILEYIDMETISADLTVGVLDERFTQKSTENNFAQVLQTSFVNLLLKLSVSVIDSRVHGGESLEDLANRFEKSLRNWREHNPDGLVVATVGIGGDGHVSGMLPTDDVKSFSDRFESVNLVCGYRVSSSVNKHTERATTTMTFFREFLDEAVVYAAGDGKREVLKKLTNQKLPFHKMPAQILKEVDGTLYTDCSLQD